MISPFSFLTIDLFGSSFFPLVSLAKVLSILFIFSENQLFVLLIFSIVFLFSVSFILFYLFIFLAALGLHCCARAFSSCSERGLLFVVVHRLLIAVASLVVGHGI